MPRKALTGGGGVAVDCVLLLALAGAMRFVSLDHASLWIDELFSVSWSQLELSFLLGEGARIETNPPGYYVLLHGWMALFGTSESALRAFSALASTLTVLVVYGIGRTMARRPTALLAGLLMGLNPVAIASAQEARGYALAALLNGFGLWALINYWRRQELTGERSWLWLAGFVAAMIATAMVHYTSLFFVAACFGAVGVRLMITRPFPTQDTLLWIGVGCLTAIALSKLLILALSLSGSDNLVWIGPLSAAAVVAFFLKLIVPYQDYPLLILAVMLVILAGALPRLRGSWLRFSVLLLIPGLYCSLFIIAGWVRPMLLSRVATWLEVPLCLLLAHAAVGQTTELRRNAAVMLCLTIFAAGLGHYYHPAKEDWRRAGQLITSHPRCTGPVLVSEFNSLGLLYYGIHPARQAYVFLPDPRRRSSVEFYLSQRLMQLPELDPAAVVGFIKTHPGAALIVRGEYTTRIPLELQEWMAQHASLRLQMDGGLTLACF
jgi:mannosyltransferase